MSDAAGRFLLVSFCNVAATPRPSCLLRMDLATGRSEWLELGFGGELLVSGAGICMDDRCIYHLSIAQQDFESRLTVLDRHSFEVLHAQALAEISDGHSIRRLGDDLVVASTGMDDVVAYRMDGHCAVQPRLVWSPTGAHDDTHHINSLEVVDGRLVCSAFGPREGDSWSGTRAGYLFDVTGGVPLLQGLRQPHSARWHDGKMYFCNSAMGTVETADGVEARLDSYSRGLDFGPGGRILVGTSVARRRLDLGPEAGFVNPNEAGVAQGRCSVTECRPSVAEPTVIDMAAYGPEIYDLYFA